MPQTGLFHERRRYGACRVRSRFLRGQPVSGNAAYVVRLTWSGPVLFGKDVREHVEHQVVEAESPDAAIRKAVNRCSVLSLEYGVTAEAVRIPWGRAKRRLAKYDAEPMIDHGIANPKAKLVIT